MEFSENINAKSKFPEKSWKLIMADEEENESELMLNSTITLRRGVKMPRVYIHIFAFFFDVSFPSGFEFGLGTWLSTGGGTCKDSVETAIKSGYGTFFFFPKNVRAIVHILT